MSRCHDPSGCTNEGMWHSWPWKWDKTRKAEVFLCPMHWARWNRWVVDFPSTAAVQNSKAAHPSNYDSIGGRVSLEIWGSHVDDCTCGHCDWVNSHMDDEMRA